jgi:hypothetical protein
LTSCDLGEESRTFEVICAYIKEGREDESCICHEEDVRTAGVKSTRREKALELEYNNDRTDTGGRAGSIYDVKQI